MAFWNETQLEPKRKFKFLMSIDGTGTDKKIPEYVVKKATKPSFSITEAKHQFLGHSFFFPGKLEWKEVDVTVVDAGGFNEKDSASAGTEATSEALSNDTTKTIMELLNDMGYQHPKDTAAAVAGTTGGKPKTFSKWGGTTALGTVTFKALDSNGEIVESWVLKNAWIKDVNFGDGDYSSDDVVDITLKLRYDWAEYTPASTAGSFESPYPRA
jgi:hypothetical protein